MGAGASTGRVTVTTPVYKAYESLDEGMEKYRHLVVVDDVPLDPRDFDNSWRTPSIDFSVSDSNTVTDDSTSRGETDSLPSSSCSPRDLKRQKRVRFANVVTVSRGRNGSVETTELATPDEERQLTLWDDGILERVVLRVDVEYGQTRSIRYDPRTSTVSDIIESLKDKLKFSSDQFLALSLVKRLADGGQPVIRVLRAHDNVHQKVTLRLREEEDLRCCLRVVFVPGDLNVLLAQDPEAFNYLYTQCCNDVIEERFAGDLNCNEVLDLAALQIVQWAYDERTKRSRIIKNIERSWDLVPFVPKSLLRTMTERQMRRRIAHLVKIHLQSFEKSFQVKREYLRRIEQLPSFARRQFQLENSNEKLLVGPKNGIEKMKGSEVFLLAKFNLLRSLTVDSRLESMAPNRTKVMMELEKDQSDKEMTLVLEASLLTDDVEDFVVWVSGYYYLYTNRKLSVRVLDDFYEDFNDGYAEYPGDSMLNSGDEGLPLVFVTSRQRSAVNDEELYNGSQVTRSHLCQPLCGYCPALEDVVNQLETVLPPQNGGSELVHPTFEYKDHELYNSNGLRETSGTTDGWTVPMSQREQPNNAGFNDNIGSFREIVYHKDIGDVGYRNGLGYDSSDVDVSFRGSVDDSGYLSCHGAPSEESWNDETLSEEEEDTISCHLRQFFDDDRSESFLPPSFLDNIPEPLLKDNDLQKFTTSGSISLILSPPVGFNDQMFPDGSHSTDASDSVLPLDIPQEERCHNHLTVLPNLEFSSLQNAIRLPSPPPSPPHSPSFPELIQSPETFTPFALPILSHISSSTPPPQLRKPLPPLPPRRSQSFPSLTPSLSSPSPSPLPISCLRPSLSPLPAPSSPSVPTPPPFEFDAPLYKDWSLLLDETDELLNKLKIQYNDQCLAERDEKLMKDGKVFPGLDRL